jgi:hypothetical protein
VHQIGDKPGYALRRTLGLGGASLKTEPGRMHCLSFAIFSDGNLRERVALIDLFSGIVFETLYHGIIV